MLQLTDSNLQNLLRNKSQQDRCQQQNAPSEVTDVSGARNRQLTSLVLVDTITTRARTDRKACEPCTCYLRHLQLFTAMKAYCRGNVDEQIHTSAAAVPRTQSTSTVRVVQSSASAHVYRRKRQRKQAEKVDLSLLCSKLKFYNQVL